MPGIEPSGDTVQYWVTYVNGVWRGWWYDPDTYVLVLHEFRDIRATMPMLEQKHEALKRTRYEMVRRYGLGRIQGEVDDA